MPEDMTDEQMREEIERLKAENEKLRLGRYADPRYAARQQRSIAHFRSKLKKENEAKQWWRAKRHEERLNRVEAMILLGVSHHEIKKQCSIDWDCTDRYVQRFISAAYERMAADAPTPLESRLENRAAFVLLWQKALGLVQEEPSPPTIRVAADMRTAIARIDGSFENTVNVNIKGNVDHTHRLTTAQQNIEIEELLERRRQLMEKRAMLALPAPKKNGSNGSGH